MGANDRFQTVTLFILERPGAGKVFARPVGRKSCRSEQLLLGCSSHWRRFTGFSPCLRTHQQSPLSGFCNSALYLQCSGLSQAVTAQWERHIPPPQKVHKTPRHPAVTSLLSPSKTGSQELSQTRSSRKAPLSAELHCCCNELQLTWCTYSKGGTKTQAPGNTCYSWSWTENKPRTGEVEILLFTSTTWTVLIRHKFDKPH